MTILPPPLVSQTLAPLLAQTSPATGQRAGRQASPRGSAFTLACVRCRHRFQPGDCTKLEHFAIYKASCPQCGWPGRYLASELKEVKAAKPPARARGRGRS